jgi:hypothetical protein
MKHTIQTLKKNLTLAEVEALEKELRGIMEKTTKDPVFQEELIEICNSGKRLMIKEILGE